MFVIEGKYGKSRILETAVNELPEGNCIVIDAVGIPIHWNGSIFVFDFRSMSHDSIVSWLKISLGKYINDEETLVLEVNCSKDKLNDYLELENILGFQRYMITLQNNETDDILQYNTFYNPISL